MPTYGYECSVPTCGHAEDLRLSIRSSPRRRKCPKCKRMTFARQIGAGSGHVDHLRQNYPYYNWQLPLKQGQQPGEPNVMSREHERDIMAGAHDGGQWERNAI